MIRPWLKDLQRRFFPSRRRVGPAIRPARPGLEQLESRVVPSTYTVTTTANSGTGSLRTGIGDVNAGTDNTIVFNIPTSDSGYNFSTGAWTIMLSSGLPALTKNATITGPGADLLTINGNNSGTVFTIGNNTTPSTPSVTISSLTITKGNATFGGGVFNWGSLTVNNSTFSSNVADYGGAIYTRSTDDGGGGFLTLNRDTFSGNKAGNGTDFGAGGAIDNYDNGAVTVKTSVFTGNSAHYGGAISNELGTMTIIDSTFTGNKATGKSDSSGGAIINNHDPADPTTITFSNGNTLTIENSTLSGNSSSGTSSKGGGISSDDFSANGFQTVTLTSSIVAGNTAASSDPDIVYIGNESGDSISATFSLIGNNQGSGIASPGNNTNNNKVGTNTSPLDPLLAPLGYYGGPTETVPLLAGSPALAAGTTAGAPSTDQRGYARVVSSKTDMGAFETQLHPYQIDSGDDTASGDAASGATVAAAAATATIAASPTGAPKNPARTVTITTTAAHNFVVGERVAIAGVTATGYDGTFTIVSVPSSTSFTYTEATTGLGTSGTGSAVPATTLTIAASPNGAKESGTTVTITTTTTLNLVVGEQIVISGVTVVGYDGTFTITSVPSSTTFTYTDATTGLANSGAGSAIPAASLTLRDALNLSNALAPSGGASITFAIATNDPNFDATTNVVTIQAAAAMPTISAAVTLDGTSEATFLGQAYSTPLIDLSGGGAGSADGLDITASNSTVKGLAINNFTGNGIALQGSGSTNDVIQGNYIGTDPSGSYGMANGGDGILVKPRITPSEELPLGPET